MTPHAHQRLRAQILLLLLLLLNSQLLSCLCNSAMATCNTGTTPIQQKSHDEHTNIQTTQHNKEQPFHSSEVLWTTNSITLGRQFGRCSADTRYNWMNCHEIHENTNVRYSFYPRSQNCEKRLFVSSCLSLCPSVRPSVLLSARNKSAPIGQIFIKFDIWIFFRKCVEKIQVILKSNKNNGYVTWRPIYLFDHISFNST